MRRAEDYIVFPLDVPDLESAMRYVKALAPHIGLFKVGLELFISLGPRIVSDIHEASGAGVFLDLKLHDIPATVSRAFMAACKLGPAFVTMHCDGGMRMLSEAAQKSTRGTKILGVTVLTSHDKESLTQLGYERQYTEDVTSLVLKRALMAREAGCDGVICSGREVKAIKREIGPDFIAMTPGIRPKWSLGAGDDQKRVVTPEDAVRDGADYIVIGRPIRDAPDPADAARKVAEEIASGL